MSDDQRVRTGNNTRPDARRRGVVDLFAIEKDPLASSPTFGEQSTFCRQVGGAETLPLSGALGVFIVYGIPEKDLIRRRR